MTNRGILLSTTSPLPPSSVGMMLVRSQPRAADSDLIKLVNNLYDVFANLCATGRLGNPVHEKSTLSTVLYFESGGLDMLQLAVGLFLLTEMHLNAPIIWFCCAKGKKPACCKV